MADNYLHFPDNSLNLVNHTTTADSAALSITDLLDVQARVLPDIWTTGSDDQTFAAKYWTASAQRSWWFRTPVNGSSLSMSLSVNGTVFNVYLSTATVASVHSLTEIVWVRVRVDCAAGFIYFYTSPDTPMLVWTQLGDPVAITEASIFDSTAPLEIAARESATSSEFGGNMYRVRIFDDVTPVFDADFSNLTAADLKAGAFTEAYGNTVTIVGDSWAYVRPVPASLPLLSETEVLLESADGNKGWSAKWADRSGNNHHAERGSAPGPNTNASLFKGYDDAEGQYAYFPGTNTNWVVTPIVNMLDGDTGNVYQSIGQWQHNAGNPPTLVSDEDAFGGKAMEQTPTLSTQVFKTAASAAVNPVMVAAQEYTFVARVKLIDAGPLENFRVQLDFRDVADAALGGFISDPVVAVVGEYVEVYVTATSPATTTYARTYVISGAGETLDGTQQVYMSQASVHEGAATTLVPSFDIQADLELEWRGTRADWVTGASGHMIGTRNSGSYGYHMIEQSEAGGESGVYCRFGNGTVQRAFNMFVGEVIDPDRVVTIKTTYEEGVGWKGYLDGAFVDSAANLDAGPGIINNNLSTGARPDGNSTALAGTTSYALVRDGIDGPIVARFDANEVASPYAGYTDADLGNVWTVNRSATGLVTTIVDRDMELFTTDDYFAIPQTTALDFAEDEDFTIMVAGRYHADPPAGTRLIEKRSTNGWVFSVRAGRLTELFFDGATASTSLATGPPATVGEFWAQTMRRDADGDASLLLDGGSEASTADTTLGTMAFDVTTYIGADSGSSLFYEGQIMAVAIWRRALTNAEIVQAGAELTRLPAEELGRHGDSLLHYLKENYTIESGEVISALNEFNGITSVGRSEYKRARDTAFGL